MSKGAAVVYFWVLCFQRFLNDLFFSKCMSGMIRVKDLIVQIFTTLNFENTSTAGVFNTVIIGAPFHKKILVEKIFKRHFFIILAFV